MPKKRTLLASLRDRIAYYEWAYGRLAEQDSDIGPVGEFLVGKLLGVLPPSRRVNSRFDLVTADGRGIEVKTTTHKQVFYGTGGRKFDYRWNVATQMRAPTNIAPIWVFLTTDFPPDAANRPRFDVFNPKYWTARLVTGTDLATFGRKRAITAEMLSKLGVEPFPLALLKTKLKDFL